MSKKNMSAFTLSETLIVLFIAILFLTLPTLAITNYKETIEAEQFIESFEKKIVYTQQMAIIMNRDTKIIFDETSQTFHYVIEDGEEVITENPPNRLSIKGPQKIVLKKKTGNNGSLSKYIFRNNEKKQVIEFQFQLGSGRYVKKIKNF